MSSPISYISHTSSGKHMVCDIKDITNLDLLHNKKGLESLLDKICEKYSFVVLEKISYSFSPEGISLIYLLSESHITIHTFPEKNYMAFDIYTCRVYDDNTVYECIYHHLVSMLGARTEVPVILDRSF